MSYLTVESSWTRLWDEGNLKKKIYGGQREAVHGVLRLGAAVEGRLEAPMWNRIDCESWPKSFEIWIKTNEWTKRTTNPIVVVVVAFSPGEKVIDSVMIESIYLYTIIVNLSAIKAWLSPVFP